MKYIKKAGFFKNPGFIIPICSALILIAAVSLFFILRPKTADTAEEKPDSAVDTVIENVPADKPETPEAQPLPETEEVKQVAPPAPPQAKKVAPVPKNYVKPLEKEEATAPQKVYEEPAPVVIATLLDVPYINQVTLYPSGCESVSAVMALKFAGYDISVNTFIDDYLDTSVAPYIGEDGKYYGYDPREYFLGDPYSKKGWGCKAPVIITALNRCTDSKRHTVEDLTGTPISSLKSYIDQNIPVIIWATQGMEKPRTSKTWTVVDTEKTYTWTAPNHCLLLVGYDDTGYYFNDPLTRKNCRYPADIAESRYNSMGREAIAITGILQDEEDETEEPGTSEPSQENPPGETAQPEESGDTPEKAPGEEEKEPVT